MMVRLLPLLLVIVCAAVCICNISHAYSTNSVYVYNNIKRRSTSLPLQQHISITNNDKVVLDKMGRRAFFHRGGTIISSATAATMITSTTPQPAHAASKKSQSTIPKLGEPAPPFTLMNTRGQIITLDILAANKKWTVLYFYPGAFTSGCTLEARRFQEELSSFQELNAQIVGVSVDSVEKNSEFCTTEKLDFYMLTDEDGEVSKSYGSSLSVPLVGTFSNRQTYIIDPQKNVRWVFVDVESRIPQHANDVLDKLKELQQV